MEALTGRMLHFKYAKFWGSHYMRDAMNHGVRFKEVPRLSGQEAAFVGRLKARIRKVIRFIRSRAEELNAFPVLPQPLMPIIKGR